MLKKIAAALTMSAAMAGAANAVVLTQGALTVNIRNDNGAINNLLFGGIEYYRLGNFVADFGFQNGTNAGTFTLFDTEGSGAAFMEVTSSTATSATAEGAALPGVAGVTINRTYTLLNGNAVRIDTKVTNGNAAALTLRMFDTLDPDQGTPQGLGASTTNDVFAVSNVKIGSSTAGTRSVAFASGEAGVVIGYGGGSSPFGLDINSGAELNTFFNTPFDPNNLFQDIGVGVGIQELLNPGEVFTFTYVQGYGINASAAIGAALLPQPSVLALLGAGLLLLGWARRSNRA